MKTRRIFLAFVLTVSLMITAILPVWATGSGTDETAAAPGAQHVAIDGDTVTVDGKLYYAIRNAQQLGAMELNKNYILANDIDCSGVAVNGGGWLFNFPGENNNNASGRTVLNGNGYTLTGINFTSDAGTVSIFNGADKKSGKADGGMTIRNLNVGTQEAPANITATATGEAYVGTLFARLNVSATLEHVTVYANLSAVDAYVGGLIGGTKWGDGVGHAISMTDCAFYGTIQSASNSGSRGTGGMIGGHTAGSGIGITMTRCINNGTFSGATAYGGMIGKADCNGAGVNLYNCINNADLTTAAHNWGSKLGGMIGQIAGGSTTVSFLLSGCINNGILTAPSKSAGGMVGEYAGYCKEVKLENCTNYGNVNGADNGTGGYGAMVGHWEVMGNGTGLTVRNSINYATVGSETAANVGSVIGVITTNTGVTSIENHLNFGTLSTGKWWKGDTVGGKADGNYAVAMSNVLNLNGKTVDEAIAELNANADMKAAFGLFMKSADGLAISATPVFAGVQQTAAENGKFNLRLVASIGNTLEYRNVGFKIIRVGSEKTPTTKSCRNVFKTLLATDAGLQTQTTAESLGGTYLYALTVTDIPVQEGEIVLNVQPYAESADGAVTYVMSSYTVRIVNGAVKDIAVAA